MILASSIILWFLQGFGWENGVFGMVEDMNNSVLAAIGSAISFVFVPLGFGTWKPTVAVFTGLIAKENVVATFGVLYNYVGELSENGDEIWTLGAIGYMCGFAYIISLIVYQIGGLITGEVSFGVGTVVAVVLIAGLLYMLFRKNKYDENTLTLSVAAAANK